MGAPGQPKTGGRVAGTPNRPKPAAASDAPAAPASAAVSFPYAPARARGTAKSAGDAGFPGYRLERLDALVPYANNARTHSAESVDRLAHQMTVNGFTSPILVAGLGILAGHRRRLAALKIGMVVVPVIDLKHLTPAQRRAYIIWDNKSALDASWDDALLALELGELRDDGFDLALTGFDAGELSALLDGGSEGLTDPDDVPEAPAEPVTRLGDCWLLGRHRLVCGDSTDAAVVEAALAGVKPHLMVTDPPYGVDYDAAWRKRSLPGTNPGKSGGMHGKVSNDEIADWSDAWALFPGDVAYVWCASLHIHEAATNLIAAGFGLRASIIWSKHQSVIGRGHYHWQHEPCWYAVRKGSAGHWQGDRKQTTVWQIDKPLNNETGHSTQKPVECMRRPIENNSAPGQAVYDPFVGSGTTLIAAEMTGRVCHAIELSPTYVDVAVLRWQAFTGQQATHVVTGQPFAARAKAPSAGIPLASPAEPWPATPA